MRETLYNEVHAVKCINTGTIATNTNTDGAAVDLDQSGQDFKVAMGIILTGARTDGTYVLTPQESADGSTGWTDIPASRLQGSASIAAANTLGQVGIIPDPANARFIRLRVVSTSVTTGATVSALLILGSPSSTPVSHA